MNDILKDIEKMHAELDAQVKNTVYAECRDVLLRYVDKIENLSEQLGVIALKSRSVREDTMLAVSDEIIRVLDGNLHCFEYSQRSKAEQELYFYDGTHWRKVGKQDYQDFIVACAERSGLLNYWLAKPNFMNGLFEQTAFRMMGARKNIQPKKEVWINFQNNTVEIKPDGKLVVREHRREDYFMYVLPYAYDPKATCPKFHTFLETILPDASTRQLIREYLASTFEKDFHDETVLNCVGDGSNGKSTLFFVLQNLFGEENISEITLTDLTNNDERRLRIEHKLLNFSEEADPNIDISMFKRLASRQAVTVEKKYKDSYEMKDYARIICACNKLPIGENNYAFYRRNILIPFNVIIPRGEADKRLRYKLLDELPGIFNWLIECLPGLMERQSFSPCQVAEDALLEYMDQLDSVRLFYKRCVKSKEYPTPSTEFYSAYSNMCYEENLKREGKTRFFKKFEQISRTTRIVGHANKSSFPFRYQGE